MYEREATRGGEVEESNGATDEHEKRTLDQQTNVH